jgi:uncharacterized protein involved in exopolysaccharide biosynthesis
MSENTAGNTSFLGAETFRKNFIFIKKRWWVFLLVGLIAGIGGFFYAKTQPVIFESKLLFALDEGGNGSSQGGLSGLVAQFGISVGNSNDVFGGDNILTILKSRRMIENVLLSVDTFENKPQTIIDYFLIISGTDKPGMSKAKFPINQERSTFSYIQDSVLYNIYLAFNKDYIFVGKPDKFLNLFEVNVRTKNEKLTKVFTDKLLAETNSFYTEMRSKKARGTLEILEQRVATMKGNLNASISNKAATQDANLNPAFAAAQVPIQKQQLNMQVYGGAYGEMFKNLELARYQYLKEIPLMQIIDPADYPMHKIKTGKIKFALIFSIFSIAFTFLVFWVIRIIRN